MPLDHSLNIVRRIALGVSYRGNAYHGWQSQPDQQTIQDKLELALNQFCQQSVSVVCAGRTDTGVHGINQVVHLDTSLHRPPASWVRGTNAFLPSDIAVQWALEVDQNFHARNSAKSRRYTYVLLQSAVRPAIESGLVGWVFKPLNLCAMQQAAQYLIGEHDFSSFRSAQCQSPSPIKHLREIQITPCGMPKRPLSPTSLDAQWSDQLPTSQTLHHSTWQGQGCYWRFDFEGKAFLHHMIRNIMGCLLAVGTGKHPAEWARYVLQARKREVAAPTFAPDGLFFVGPSYDPSWKIPNISPAIGWLPHSLSNI